jgi:hypothetical protein
MLSKEVGRIDDRLRRGYSLCRKLHDGNASSLLVSFDVYKAVLVTLLQDLGVFCVAISRRNNNILGSTIEVVAIYLTIKIPTQSLNSGL